MTFGRILAACGAALAIAGSALAATYDLRDAEVISISGSSLIVREGSSASQYTVGSGATFTVDGATTSLSSLKPGMKVTGPVVTETPPVAMSLVDLKDTAVEFTRSGSLIVAGDQKGQYLHFSSAGMGDRGILVYRGGTLVPSNALVTGDRITATVVTKLPPKEMAEEDLVEFVESAKRQPGTVRSIANTPRVDRSAAKALMGDAPPSNAPAPPSAPTAAPAPEAAATAPTPSATPSTPASPPHVTAPPPRPAPASSPSPAAAPPAPPAPTSAAHPKQLPKTASARPALVLAGLALAGFGAILTLRRRRGASA